MSKINRIHYIIIIVLFLLFIIIALIVRESAGERYFSCIGHQKKTYSLKGDDIFFNSYVTLSLQADKKGRALFRGYVEKDKQLWKINRVVYFTFATQANNELFSFSPYKVDKSPDDSSPDEIFNRVSDIHSGSSLLRIWKQGDKTLVIGDSLQPKLVCVRTSNSSS